MVEQRDDWYVRPYGLYYEDCGRQCDRLANMMQSHGGVRSCVMIHNSCQFQPDHDGLNCDNRNSLLLHACITARAH